MEEDLKLKDLILDEILDDIKDILLDVYEQNEMSTTTEYDDNYTFFASLYRKSLNALNIYSNHSKLVENLSCNGKAILQPTGSRLYLRFLNCTPSEHRRKKSSNDIYDLFSIFEKPSFSYSLFEEAKNTEKLLFGFFFIETNADDIPYVRLQILDEAWNLILEWSSDKVQNKITFSSDSFDEKSKDLPKVKLLKSGSDILIPDISAESNADAANE
ncbi:MAG: hypothetical protein N2B04_02575 [Psychrobacter sp.]